MRLWRIAASIGISDYVGSQIDDKLMRYLDNPDPVALKSYGITFSESDKDMIRGMLASIVSHKPLAAP